MLENKGTLESMYIDEWLPLYNGNIYIVDEVTGRMYLSKGEHPMQNAETASHHPFQDHELSMSRHIPEREHLAQGGQGSPLGMEPGIAGEGGGNVNPLTPTMGAVGEIGRTLIPVAESTCHPGERPLTPVVKHKRERPDRKGESSTPTQSQGGTTGVARGDHQGGNLNGHCLNPQTRVGLQEGGPEKRRYLFGTLWGQVKALLSRNTPSLTNN